MSASLPLSPGRQAVLERLLRGEAALRDPDPIMPRAAGAVVPISAEQEHVWLHASLAPDVPLYNEAITIHRRGPCDPALLEASFLEVLRRHEIWRTSFAADDSGIVQRVHDEIALRLPLTDLTVLPRAERESAALQIATQEARLPFDLGQAPLLRGRIVQLGEAEHRLYLTLHHIIFDGVSIYRVLMPLLAAIYADFAAGRALAAAGLPKPRLQYGDYALWRARQARSPEIGRQMAYWSATLSGELPALRLPADRSSPPAGAHRGGTETFALSAGLTAGVKRASRALGITQYALLLAAFKALLFRYSGQTDLIVGGVADMRRRPALEPMMGYFLNTLPIRTRPAHGMPFRDYARQTAGAVLGALDAADVPFAQLVRALRPRRDAASHPLFQVLFSIEPPAPEFAEGWDLTQMDVAVGAAKFDLYLELDERPEGLIGRFLYRADLFDQATIRRMIGHWRTLIESAVADPDCALGQLPLLTAPELARLAGWSAGPEREAPAAPLHVLFEAQARRTPAAVAVVAGRQACSYRALDRRAEWIAARLRQAGSAPGGLVAVCIERSVGMVAALLGILKTGAAYMPLDATLPRARLAHCLAEARPTLVLTQSRLRRLLPQTDAPVLVLNGLAGIDTAPEPVPVDLESLAYVLCTSGTTGQPKAVEITHRAVVNLLAAMRETPGFRSADSLLAVTRLTFDIAALELFLPLLSGGRVILASREDATDPFRLAALMQRMQPTVMQATPSTWRALIDAGWQGQPGLKILVGGEALPRPLADALLQRASSVWNMYGPTETTIWSTVHRVEPGEGPVPIGRPIANTTVFVLDRQGRTVPAGVPGELHIGGAGVARGYRNAAALTQQRFAVADAAPGQRLYRTGDLARFGSDGTLEWLGRDDDQVKIRGHRFCLAEIEARLETHPAIAAAAVVPRPDRSGTLSLAAYVVPRAAPPQAAELRRFLGQSLPEYMLPAHYVPVSALPLTPHGKIDRGALPDPSPPPAASPTAPRSPQERALATIYSELLGRSEVGVADSFFDLGGHSLLAARLVRQIELVFGRRLPLTAIFEAPTITQLAARLQRTETAPGGPADGRGRELMLRFENLGDDCEFGLVQRRYGAEPLSLLRFTGIGLPGLLAGLAHRFEGIADPAALTVTPGAVPGEFVVHNTRYDCAYVTFGAAGEPPEALLAREATKLRTMRPMLLRVLERGTRVCVFKSRADLEVAQAGLLSMALRRYGPTTLLWVRLADAGHRPGSVAWLGEHLLGGWIDRFAPENDPRESSAMWLTLCQRAWQLWREAQEQPNSRFG
jgi:amino acid adenylation domain-containing protein